MEVGEYIRTKDGQIGIFQNIDEHCRHYGERLEDTIYIINTEKNEYLRLIDSNITKHSKNIIDLIEVGDYVNGMRVIATENRGRYNEEKQKDEKVILAENYDEWTENGVISNEDIKSILTHEQFEQNCYKVGVENE